MIQRCGSGAWWMHSKIHVCSYPGNDDRPPVPVVAWIVDIRELYRHVKAAHDMNVVIGLAHGFAAVVQAAITEDESQSAQRQILLVLAADAASLKSGSDLIFFSAPR